MSMCACTDISIDTTYAYVYLDMHICRCACLYVRKCVYVYACMCTYVYSIRAPEKMIWMYVYMHMYVCIYKYIRNTLVCISPTPHTYVCIYMYGIPYSHLFSPPQKHVQWIYLHFLIDHHFYVDKHARAKINTSMVCIYT